MRVYGLHDTQEVTESVFLICLEAFTVTNFNKILSGRRLNQNVKIFQQTQLSAQDFNECMFYLVYIYIYIYMCVCVCVCVEVNTNFHVELND